MWAVDEVLYCAYELGVARLPLALNRKSCRPIASMQACIRSEL